MRGLTLTSWRPKDNRNCEPALPDWLTHVNTPAGVLLAASTDMSVTSTLVAGFWLVNGRWTDRTPFVRFHTWLTETAPL